MGQPSAQLIHQLDSELVALDPDMDVQPENQDEACDILKFFFELAIALIR
jgi:hypothetical protein